MSKNITLLAAFALPLLAASFATADHSNAYKPKPTFPNTTPMPPHRHSSTVAEGWMRGRAAMIQAEANSRQQTADAAVVWEHARSLAYDNYLKKTETFHERKYLLKQYREQRQQEFAARRARGLQIRLQRESELAQLYRLSATELNLATGEISWPKMLSGKRYEQHRRSLEEMMRAVTCYKTYRFESLDTRIVKTCKDFQRQIRADYQTALERGCAPSRSQFASLEKFIRGLKYTPTLLNNRASQSIAMN